VLSLRLQAIGRTGVRLFELRNRGNSFFLGIAQSAFWTHCVAILPGAALLMLQRIDGLNDLNDAG
jgi:hypothetical protein